MKGIDVDKRLVINEVVYIVAGVDILGLEHEIVIYVYVPEITWLGRTRHGRSNSVQSNERY
jgi:hypothetical protein